MANRSPIKEWAQLCPSTVALKSEGRDYTWSEVDDLVDSVAASLFSQGIKSADVLTCVGKNSLEILLAYLACMELGAICALVMPQTRADFDTKLKTLYPSEIPVKVCSTDPNLSEVGSFRIDSQAASSENFSREYDQDRPASIIFTSGSTGTPKAVVHTSRQHFYSASGLLDTLRFTKEDTWLLSLPMYHVSGLAIVYRWLYSGAALKLASGELTSDLIGVTHASFVPTQLQRALENKAVQGLSHVLLGGSHIPLSLCQEASQLGVETWVGYGMTEAASTVTAKKVDGSDGVGKVLKNRRLKLKRQRIYISGETLASGYYQQGDITPITNDAWFDTKDLGSWQNDELHVTGRADNLFVSGGENIHCEEIEAVLNQIPNVIQAIVVPIEDKEYGHRPVAVIKSDKGINIADIEQYLSRELIKFKWPIAYYDMPENLQSHGIKISRLVVNQWVWRQVSN
ncbi:o-succinylbenzoate--CoA ligase [Vibrio sp. OCN044]|uniref:O-succinylbenzoate--CoA ligase n=1 Tax=Vibrio tetraodonis subsp. pristinus TaxID=2695891 RepID=A0A6L8LV58_9VIBR|nr:o-succinylbenzoate--CoA ligase [Vibrio tetraodonis]MYM59974.1 o-succinylbenzoate--CoA ligase [Vibrio tetraodonis subsp. pristinus]